MYLLDTHTSKFTKSDLDKVIEANVSEGIQIEFKKELKIGADNDRKEFISDLTAIANTEGGVLFVGIEESKDSNEKNTGIADKITPIDISNIDHELQKINSFIRSGTNPPLTNVHINPIEIESNMYVLVFTINAAIDLPIMNTAKGTNKFFKRNSVGKFPVDVYELSEMFNKSQTNRDRIQKFIFERHSKVRYSNIIPNLDKVGSFFVHLSPISTRNHIDFSDDSILKKIRENTKLLTCGYSNQIYNIDGYLLYRSNKDNVLIDYQQIFRNGTFEFYSSRLLKNPSPPKKDISGKRIEGAVLKTIMSAFDILDALELNTSLLLNISMFDTNGILLYSNSLSGDERINQDEIHLPPIILNKQNKYELGNSLKSIFDTLWQASGHQMSPSYKDGEYITEFS